MVKQKFKVGDVIVTDKDFGGGVPPKVPVEITKVSFDRDTTKRIVTVKGESGILVDIPVEWLDDFCIHHADPKPPTMIKGHLPCKCGCTNIKFGEYSETDYGQTVWKSTVTCYDCGKNVTKTSEQAARTDWNTINSPPNVEVMLPFPAPKPEEYGEW